MQIISNKRLKAMETQIQALQKINLTSGFNNFSTQIFPVYLAGNELTAYSTMDDVYSVISKLATTSAMIPLCAVDEMSDTDLPPNDKLTQFLKTLDFSEKEKMYTFLYTWGEVFAFKVKLDQGVNAGLNRLMFLHPANMVVVLSEYFPVEIIGYTYYDSVRGIRFDIPYDDIMYIKFFNPSNNYLYQWRGLSPIKVLAQRLTRIQSGMDASVGQLQNGGLPGIVFDKTPGIASDVIGKRRDSFGRFLRNDENKGAPYFAANELGYIPLGTPLADLEVSALANVDFEKICNAYGVSSVLFNNKQASTESNVQEMVKEMYTNTIIPNVFRICEALNKDVVPEIKTNGIVECDASEVEALQEDQQKLTSALAQAWWLTGNEKRERSGFDQDTSDENMDKYLVPSSLVTLDDLTMAVPPIPNTAGDYGKVVPLKQAIN